MSKIKSSTRLKSSKRRLLNFSILLILPLCLLLPATALWAKKPQTASPQTYTVLVGLEQSNQGIGVNAYFPRRVTIHQGDTVQWIQNSNEIHTVTFPDGILQWDLLLPSEDVGADPDVSPLVFAPNVVLQNPPSGSEFSVGIGRYANSGIMGREAGQVREYDLTFPSEGTFGYFCVVHGRVMSGEVVVVGDDDPIPSPQQAMAQVRQEMAEALALVPSVVRDAAEQVMPPRRNGHGITTHTVMLGFSETLAASFGDVEIDLMRFFPNKLRVRPGDTVTFEMSEFNVAPHTATFLNGEEEPPLAVFDNGFLYLNEDVFSPSGTNILTRTGLYNSGLMLPIPGTSYTLTIGDIEPGLLPFLCLLHDSSGMRGELMVVPPAK